MTEAIGTLLCWNSAENLASLFWHETARAARTVTLDELGDVCRIAVRPPPGVRMASLPPPDISYLEHGGQSHLLAAALLRLLDGARPLRVLAAGAIRSTVLFEAAVAAFGPDVLAAPPGGLGDPLLRWPSLDCEVHCVAALRPTLETWRRHFETLALQRRGSMQHYRIDELVTAGLPPFDPETPVPLARIACGRRIALLLPGCGGGTARLVLHLLGSGDDAACLLIDGCEVDARWLGDRAEVRVVDLPPLACHLLEIVRERGPDLVLAAVEFGPANRRRDM